MADSVYFKKISKADFDKIIPDAHTLYIVHSGDIPPFPSHDSGLYDTNDNLLMSWDDLKSNNYLKIKDDVYGSATDVLDRGSNASGLKALTEILYIDNEVKVLEQLVFQMCHFSKIVIPDSVTLIRQLAFQGSQNDFTSVEIGNGVIQLEKRLFSDCSSLQNVVLGNKIEIIGEDIFEYCTSLTEITYLGTMAEWNAINKASSWIGKFCNLAAIHCTDETITL